MAISDSLLRSSIHELTVCQHLHSKLDSANADWRPRPNMRSTVELMQYLTYIGGTMTKHFTNPAEDHEAARNTYRANAKLSRESVTFENFSDAIDREKEEIRSAYATITDADLHRMTYHPFSNDETTLFEALLTVNKYLCAYRHQLFMYAKMCGAEINTRNNWYGLDAPPAPVKQAVAATGAAA